MESYRRVKKSVKYSPGYDSPSDRTLPTSVKKNYELLAGSRNKAVMNSADSKKSKASMNMGTQREAYSQELESFIDNTLKVLAKKIAYKKSLEAAVSSNFKQSRKTAQEITEVAKANDYLNIKVKRQQGSNEKLESAKGELEEMLAVVDEKLRKTSFGMNCRLVALKNTQENLTNRLINLNERFEGIMMEKAVERNQLKQDIDDINTHKKNTQVKIQGISNEIAKSKTSEYQHMRKIMDNCHLLTTLSQREATPIEKTARAEDIKRILNKAKCIIASECG
eukprot:TRINITY_DN3125_c0_g1_i16.p1 TRINITY_DN3125_c0_g1~~TRINITY_DN3125_c0_g1_i16.p1  ORF type:complete len:280 (-),score=77.38 TRINITY_DN3125_c0_g1_i16:113-952(-)